MTESQPKPTANLTPKLPHDLPDYDILEVLGRGGMGVVYRARQKKLDRIVALKTVLLQDSNQATALDRLEQEARVVAKLRHPHIVTAFDIFRHGQELFFAMEFLEGETLEQRINRIGKLAEAEIWGYVRQAAVGLAEAQKEGIIHRDIKPANLMLVEPPEGFSLPAGVALVKIMDFGVALSSGDSVRDQNQAASLLEQTYAFEPEQLIFSTVAHEPIENGGKSEQRSGARGTPVYMAPEQISGFPVDFRADVYALGSTAFHALAGQPPFPQTTLMELLFEKVQKDLPNFSILEGQVSELTLNLLKRMLHRNPEERIESWRGLIDRIDAVLLSIPGGANLSDTFRRVSLSRTDLVQAGQQQGNRSFAATATNGSTNPLLSLGLFAGTLVAGLAGGYLIYSTTISSSESTVVIDTSPQTSAQTSPTQDNNFWQPAVVDWPTDKQLREEEITYLFIPNSEPLDLLEWTPTAGTWDKAKDAESSDILFGVPARGGISRVVRRNLPVLESFRLELNFDLFEANAVEIQFALPDVEASEKSEKENSDRYYYLVRATREWVTLGRRPFTSDETLEKRPELQQLPDPVPYPFPTPQPNLVREQKISIDYLPALGFRVKLGNVVLGTLPPLANLRRGEFALVSEGGKAHFSGIQIFNLVQTAASPIQ